MRLVDRLNGGIYLQIKPDRENYLTLQLIERAITISSRNSTGALYQLAISESQNALSQMPGMRFIVVDNRTGVADIGNVVIYPVSYKHDELKIQEEFVEIRKQHIFSVNKGLQRKYCRYANLLLKNIALKGYLKEYVQMPTVLNEIVCNCGNTKNLDAFVNCDEFGDEIKDNLIEPAYLLCNNCKRIIDLSTFEVIAKKGRNDNDHIQINLILNTNKSLNEMSDQEKAKLLHTLCPEPMRGFITYVLVKATFAESNPKAFTRDWENDTISVDGRIDIAKEVKQKISTALELLISNSDFFATQLFGQYSRSFLMHCIQEYINYGRNERFNKGIEFIFDL